VELVAELVVDAVSGSADEPVSPVSAPQPATVKAAAASAAKTARLRVGLNLRLWSVIAPP